MGNNDSEIDRVVLSFLASTPGHWKKIALVIGEVSHNLKIPLEDAECDLIGQRIEVLIADGKLEAQGDVKKWRYSEVRISQ